MDIRKIPVGQAPPDNFNVIVEIAKGDAPVRYETDAESGALVVSRFLHSANDYPVNSGFIPHTEGDDGQPLRVLIIASVPLLPGAVVACRAVGLMSMRGDDGATAKVIAVPQPDLHPFYRDITSYRQLPEDLIEEISRFFSDHKELEPIRNIAVDGWRDGAHAERHIQAAILRAAKLD